MYAVNARNAASFQAKSVQKPTVKGNSKSKVSTPDTKKAKKKSPPKQSGEKGGSILAPEDRVGCEAILSRVKGPLKAALPLDDDAALMQKLKDMREKRHAQDQRSIDTVYQTVLSAVREGNEAVLVKAAREALGKRENKRGTLFGLLFEVMGHPPDAASKRAAICRYALARRLTPGKVGTIIRKNGGIEKTCQMARQIMKALDGEMMVALVNHTAEGDKEPTISDALIAVPNAALAADVFKAFVLASKEGQPRYKLGNGIVPILKNRMGKVAASKNSE